MEKSTYRIGLICALSCAFLWGVLPIYWQALRPVDSFEIIFFRIFFCGLTTFVCGLKIYGREKMLAPFKNRRQLAIFAVAGVLISMNWSVYIWAVNANYVIQTSIGYYLEPLVVCLFGKLIFREKLNRFKVLALILAFAGVMVVILHFHQVPLIALGLCLTFAIYAAIKKYTQAEAIIALFYETVFLMPLALAAMISYEWKGMGICGIAQPYQVVLLVLAGVVTATPLALYAMAANRIPLITLGVTEYITPTLSLIIGIFLFKEPFDRFQFVAFAIIWIGIVVFTYGEYLDYAGLNKEKEKKI